MKGLTGTIKFDQHGLRTDFNLEIVELKKDGLVKVSLAQKMHIVISLGTIPIKSILTLSLNISRNFSKILLQVGTWNEAMGVNFTRNFTESYSEIVESLQNKTLIVTTIYVSNCFSMHD